MFARLVSESFIRNPRRKLLTAAALVVGMAVATATLTVALEVGDRLAREFRTLGANLVVTPESDTLPLQIGGVDYRPVDEGAYLQEADLGKLKTIFWRHNILGFTPFLDTPASVRASESAPAKPTTLIGTWYDHSVPVPDGTQFRTGVSITHPSWNIRGRWFQDTAQESVVGAAFAANYPGGIMPGQTIYVDVQNGAQSQPQSVSLVVTGILSTGDAEAAEDNAVLVPLQIAQRLSGHPGQFRSLFISALTKPADALALRDPSTLTPKQFDQWFCSPYISSISYQITQVLPGTDVRAIRRVADTEGKILSHVSTLLWIVTLAALIAAALAVAATSAATVLERRAEVGVMKAIGATNVLVAGIFLAEQLMLALAGGAVGFVLGLGFARVLGTSVFGSPAPPRLILLPAILGLAAIVAIIGSMIPMWRAARLNPAPVLRGRVMFWRLLWRLLRGSRGRLAVALIALISGAAVVSALLNLDLDIERKLTQEFRALGANLVISSGRASQGADSSADAAQNPSDLSMRPTLINEADVLGAVDRVRDRDVIAAAPYLYIVAKAGDKPLVVAGTWLDQARGLAPTWKLDGNWVSSRDDEAQALVGRNVARQFHLAPGSEFDLSYLDRAAHLRVAGVVDAGGADDDQTFVNLPVAQELAAEEGKIQLVQLSVGGNSTSIAAFESRLASALPGYDVKPIRQVAEAQGTLLNRIHLLIVSMIVLILALTALCVLATMAALAMERREDVGLMKALGGSISRIVSIFMAEVGVLGAVGGLIGCLLGIALSNWMGQRVFGTSITPRWEILPITIVLTVIVALAGALPLRLLGKIKPAVILRGE